MDLHIWSLVLTAIGILGFWLAGKKIWWSWYINIFNQVLWFSYAIFSQQYGFILAALFYTVVFGKNAYQWTRDRNKVDNEDILSKEFREGYELGYRNSRLQLNESEEKLRAIFEHPVQIKPNIQLDFTLDRESLDQLKARLNHSHIQGRRV